MNIRQIKAREKENKEKILSVCPTCPSKSGIYFLFREDDGFRYAYVGQAKNILSRLAGHLSGYQHIDLSLRKHGLYSEQNKSGWKVAYIEVAEDELDEAERNYILRLANDGYQLRNKTSGGQDGGKKGISPNRQSRGYYDGLEQGKKKSREYIADLFAKHLTVSTKKTPPTKLQEKAMQKFMDFIDLSDFAADREETR